MTDKPESRLECKYEDWDDTCEPIVCHCMKFPTAQCIFRTDVKQCPNYNPKVLSATPDMEGLKEELAIKLFAHDYGFTVDVGWHWANGQSEGLRQCYIDRATQLYDSLFQPVLASKDLALAAANEKIAKLEAENKELSEICDANIEIVLDQYERADRAEAQLKWAMKAKQVAHEKNSQLQSQLSE